MITKSSTINGKTSKLCSQKQLDTLPKKKISPYIYQDKSTSNELKHLQLQNSLLNQIYYTVYQFLYETDTSYTKVKQLQYLWTDKKPACRRSCLIEINSQYANTDGHFDPLTVLYLLTGSFRTQLKNLLEDINSLRSSQELNAHF